nr:MAG TPA: hypothetical protein [Caudoviricetes sp.]
MVIHTLLIYLYQTFQLANIGYNSIIPIYRIMENPADLPPHIREMVI